LKSAEYPKFIKGPEVVRIFIVENVFSFLGVTRLEALVVD